MTRHFLIGSLLITSLTSPVWAADESREKQMLRRMQLQMQQVEQARGLAEQEKAAALADKDKLERELEQAKSAGRKLSGERAARNRAERALKAAEEEISALKARLAETDAQLATSQATLQSITQTLTRTEGEKRQAESSLVATRKDLGQCRSHNGELYSLSREMMTKYRDKTCQDALVQAEPFSGIRKVQIENLLETWRDAADRERLSVGGIEGSRPRQR